MKIIAESAYNHMGRWQEAVALLEAAHAAKADYFTMQIMNPEIFSEKTYSKHQLYIDHNITYTDWDRVFQRATELGIHCIPCPLDIDSLEYVLSKKPDLIKIHATDLTNKPLLERIKHHGAAKILLETQAATNFEIRFALEILGHLVEAILTGYSNYPTELEDINLLSLDAIARDYGFPVGLADHSPTVTEIALMALAKGCAYFEKHITLTRNNRNFDWQVSLYPEEFSMLTSKVALYAKSLGSGVKHPVAHERPFRDILYKKVMGDGSLKRSDNSPSLVAHTFESFAAENVTIAIIARLSSQRLPKKVLAELGEASVIENLYQHMQLVKSATSVVLATSTHAGDTPLATFAESKGMTVFRGHPESVIDRMLDLAWKNKSGIILRVTGDNPFTNPQLTDAIIDLMQSENLDYTKVNNAPFGVSAEAFRASYLWRLYVEMENPMVSEYLTWFVLNDSTCRKGCIDLEFQNTDWSLKNLSIDYPSDLEDARKVLTCAAAKSTAEISLSTLLNCCASQLTNKEDTLMKLPGDQHMLLSEYLDRWKNTNYQIRLKFRIES